MGGLSHIITYPTGVTRTREAWESDWPKGFEMVCKLSVLCKQLLVRNRRIPLVKRISNALIGAPCSRQVSGTKGCENCDGRYSLEEGFTYDFSPLKPVFKKNGGLDGVSSLRSIGVGNTGSLKRLEIYHLFPAHPGRHPDLLHGIGAQRLVHHLLG